ncbi:DUF1214 domain-containing protein [Parasphingopyxis lamellibrachiae]|uniref:DUF1214 domain-containing protein n=1 Tax=Parasphingopyxis lamellibrachiae TaxID=680125 RepID=A0A3D9FBR8_9SPHN|nr:DUF1214 domain-containing protein [Parasphingopyxis lamellibrachiae]RED15259.1 hypothetical protein DFR46_0246 [Parasphingopyxis lamellibrachiae]
MRLALRIVCALILGIAIGLGAVWWSLRAGIDAFDIRSGPWVTSQNFGSAEASDRERAIVAVRGLMALTASEAIYLNAAIDSEGRALDGGCRYRISGPPLPARWWSVTAYGTDSHLIPNATHAYSAGGDGAEPILAMVGPEASAADVVTRAGEAFELTIRAYGPGDGLVEGPLPEIERLSC